ncbi:lytic transglycosylase domain-containing protein [bacterium]|nr:lytic transglycosylase domain-containing protein [bacterium]
MARAGILRGLVWMAIIIAVVVVVIGPTELRYRLLTPAETALAVDIAVEIGVDAALVLALIEAESSFDPEALSSAGAVGLMQLMPGTAEEIARKHDLSADFDLRDPETNLRLGCLLLRDLLARYGGDTVSALAAYNAGPRDVNGWRSDDRLTIEEIPYPTTRAYVDEILELKQTFSGMLLEGELP